MSFFLIFARDKRFISVECFFFIILIYPGINVMFSALFFSVFDNVILILEEEFVSVTNGSFIFSNL